MKILHTKVLIEREKKDPLEPEESIKKGKVLAIGSGGYRDSVFIKSDDFVKVGDVVDYRYPTEYQGQDLVDITDIIAIYE